MNTTNVIDIHTVLAFTFMFICVSRYVRACLCMFYREREREKEDRHRDRDRESESRSERERKERKRERERKRARESEREENEKERERERERWSDPPDFWLNPSVALAAQNPTRMLSTSKSECH